MNLNNEDFYKSLKDSLSELPEPLATDTDWQSFKTFQTTVEPKKKKGFIWYILPASLLTGLLVAASFLWTAEEKHLVKKAETITTQRVGLIAKVNPEVEEPLEVVGGPVKQKEKQKEKEKEPIDAARGPVKEKEEQKEPLDVARGPEMEAGIGNSPNNSLSDLAIIFTSTNLEIASRSISFLPLQPLSLTPVTRVLGSNRNIKKPMQADWLAVYAIAQSNTLNQTPSLGAGFSLGKELGKGWYASLGVEYGALTQSSEYHWNHSFESHDLDTNLRMDIVANKIVMVMDSVFENRTHNETVKEKTISSRRNIDIPIEIGYTLHLGKLNLGAVAGMYHRIIYTQSNQLSEFTLRNQNQTNFTETYTYQFMNHAGLTAAYPLSNKLWVQATPMVLFNFLDKQNMLSESRLRIGLRYYLK
jgi:hypothetical protein